MGRGVVSNPVECSRCHRIKASPKDGLCVACRNAIRGFGTAKYFWTPEQDAALRRVYARVGELRTRRGVIALAVRATGMPRSIVRLRAQRLGLTFRVGRAWSPQDIETLRECSGSLSVKAIARKLHRSFDSVCAQMERLRISRAVVDGYTSTDLSQLFGVAPAIVQRWEARGYLVRRAGRFSDIEVLRFVQAHPEEYDLAKVEQFWFKSLLFPGAACFTARGAGGAERVSATAESEVLDG
jgi:DNA-binding transcriptional regulator YiaG